MHEFTEAWVMDEREIEAVPHEGCLERACECVQDEIASLRRLNQVLAPRYPMVNVPVDTLDAISKRAEDAEAALDRVRDARGREGPPDHQPPHGIPRRRDARGDDVDRQASHREQTIAEMDAARSPQDEDARGDDEVVEALRAAREYIASYSPRDDAGFYDDVVQERLDQIDAALAAQPPQDEDHALDLATQAMLDALARMDPQTGRKFMQEPSYLRLKAALSFPSEAGRLHAGTGSDRIFMHSTHQRPMAGCRLCEAETARSPQDEDHERLCDDKGLVQRAARALARCSPPELDLPWDDLPAADRAPYEGAAIAVLMELGDTLSRVSPSRVGSVAVEDVEKALFTFQDEFVRECGIGATSDFVVRRVQAILAEFSRSSTDRPEQPEPDVLGGQPPAEPGKPENG
jgi:hypothetical protein